MIVHALVEGPSEKVFLESWAPRFLKGHQLKAYPHQGKGTLSGDPRRRGLLDQLEAKLTAFGQSLDSERERVLVLVDADDDNIDELKAQLDEVKSRLDPAPVVLFRLAVEELEAFYLADLRAMKLAFPGFDRQRAQAYVPDSICGTWELFGAIVYDGGGNKVSWAQELGPRVTVRPEESRSPSFKALCSGLKELVVRTQRSKTRRKKPRRAKRAVQRDKTGKRQW